MQSPCDEFLADPSRNPRTRRMIKKSGKVYKDLVIECGDPEVRRRSVKTKAKAKSKTKTRRVSQKCELFFLNPVRNPTTNRIISPRGKVYKDLVSECGDPPTITNEHYHLPAHIRPNRRRSPLPPNPLPPSPLPPRTYHELENNVGIVEKFIETEYKTVDDYENYRLAMRRLYRNQGDNNSLRLDAYFNILGDIEEHANFNPTKINNGPYVIFLHGMLNYFRDSINENNYVKFFAGVAFYPPIIDDENFEILVNDPAHRPFFTPKFSLGDDSDASRWGWFRTFITSNMYGFNPDIDTSPVSVNKCLNTEDYVSLSDLTVIDPDDPVIFINDGEPNKHTCYLLSSLVAIIDLAITNGNIPRDPITNQELTFDQISKVISINKKLHPQYNLPRIPTERSNVNKNVIGVGLSDYSQEWGKMIFTPILLFPLAQDIYSRTGMIPRIETDGIGNIPIVYLTDGDEIFNNYVSSIYDYYYHTANPDMTRILKSKEHWGIDENVIIRTLINDTGLVPPGRNG